MSVQIISQSWCVEMRRARKDKRITQKDMARRTSISQPRISQIENGQVDPKLSEIVAISEALDSVLVFVPTQIVSELDDTLLAYARQHQKDRPLTIPEMILGDRAYT